MGWGVGGVPCVEEGGDFVSWFTLLYHHQIHRQQACVCVCVCVCVNTLPLLLSSHFTSRS